MNRKHKPFASLSRRKRRARVLRIKNLIHRERERCGGDFYDDCDIAYATASGCWTWSDILFTSRDPATFWNAEIVTASQKFADCVEQITFDESWALLTEDERNRESDLDTINQPGIKYPQFGGLTWSEYIDKRTQEVARDNPPAVFCGYDILPGFGSGIGLLIVVDAPVLTAEVIEAAIADFRARGERAWSCDVPAKVSLADQEGVYPGRLLAGTGENAE